MFRETITRIETRIEKAGSLNDTKKKELLDLHDTILNYGKDAKGCHSSYALSHTELTKPYSLYSPYSFYWVSIGYFFHHANDRVGAKTAKLPS